MHNLRDVAGASGYPTAGSRMRTGVLFRSEALADDAPSALTALGLTRVYDLRTTIEVDKHPDVLPAGTGYARHNILGDDNDLGTLDPSTLRPGSARRMLLAANRSFVTEPGARAAFGGLLHDIATTDGPQLFHCTAGKDRTGWAAAILQSLSGASRADVLHDYLLTNEYSRDAITAIGEAVAAEHGADVAVAVREMYGVFPEALEAGFDELGARYGTVDRYVREGLGLTPDTVDALRAKLVV
ncbi:tyrosine-protein phosphatase [Tsukamurella soli]|uniref:Tyrosine/lipid phosphatase LipA n=1 Tax=Tsukamurella soli TaxID=644556 RepID=A0ABP8KJW3_9ACTN